ncbi:MAG: restriction endonuclease subunit S [Rhizobiales bacterium]|nr:restriction endonuclease subunit S [Hyphomicrobiales bacterium]
MGLTQRYRRARPACHRPNLGEDHATRLGELVGPITAAGTVIFSRTATVGKSTILAVPMTTTQDFANYVCGPEVHNRYLMYLFRFMRGSWKQLMAGSIHNTVYMPVFKRLQVLVPPLPEQQAIAEALGDADALIEALEALIAKKRWIKQGAMQDLLTGQRRLPGFQGEWSNQALGALTPVLMGQSPPSSSYNRQGSGLPLVQGAADIVNRQAIRRVFTTEPQKIAPTGSILLTVRAPVGEVSLAGFEVCLGRGMCALSCQTGYLFHALVASEKRWASTSKGSTFDAVAGDDARKFSVAVPPTLDEQRAIAAVLSDMDAEIAALEAKLAKARDVKQGMMQVLLTGEIRLT